MLVLISVDGLSDVAQTDMPMILVSDAPPEKLDESVIFLPAEGKGRGARLRQAFAWAFDVLGADGVITLPEGGADLRMLSRIEAIASALADGAAFVDGGLQGNSPFAFGTLIRLLTAFTIGSRRIPWCGLRGYSRELSPLLASVGANGSEYDTVLLQAAVTEKITVTDLPEQGEEKLPTSVRPTLHSSICGVWGIFWNSTSLKFMLSAVIAFLLDNILLLILASLLPFAPGISRSVAKVLSWIGSSQTNFHLNRLLVFRKQGGIWKAMAQYYSLAVFVLIGKVALLSCLGWLPLLVANLICEITFFLVNYIVQKKLIFKKK